MKKKFMSLILILIFSLLPAFAAKAEVTYTYNFMRLQTGQWSNNAYHPSQVTSWGWETSASNYHNRTTDPYVYYGTSAGASWSWKPSSANPPEFGPYFTGTQGEWVGWTVRVGASGEFTPSVTFAGVPDGGTFDVYLAPADASDPMAEDYLLGEMNTQTEAVAYQQTAAFSPVTLTAGDYAFIMKITSAKADQWVSRFTLTSVGAVEVPDTPDTPDVPSENVSTKTRATYMTEKKRTAAQENVKNYAWAQDEANIAIREADKYVGDLDYAWNLITSQDLPRGIHVRTRWDPEPYDCPYCGENTMEYTGEFYAWQFDVENDPWKITCPACLRRFPSNDFGKFFDAGINDHGWFDYDLAKQNGSQYLTNDLYPEKGTGWGVDDGYGYITNETYSMLLGYGTAPRRHMYISYYNHWALWYRDEGMVPHGSKILHMLEALGNAYAYTGDLKYGRVGAVMMDRIADVYPDMYVSDYFPTLSNSDFNTARGRIVGGIWETMLARELCKFYDYFFPAFDDEEVVSFLSSKAETYSLSDARGAHGTASEGKGGVGNDKSTPAKIRQNIENGLIREVIKGVRSENEIYGNEGMHQSTVAMAAVVLDSPTETPSQLSWALGNLSGTLLSTIDRDGQGVESAPGYSNTWVDSYGAMVDTLYSYDGYSGANFYQNPRFIKLLKTNFPLTLTRNATAPIGDSGGYGGALFNLSQERLATAFSHTKDVEIGQFLYFLSGNNYKNIKGDIFTSGGDLAADVKTIIEEHGEYPFDESSAMTGPFGFYALRERDRDFWMHFGRTTNHGHPSAMNLGMDAFGIPMLSDFGYPESTSGTNRTLNWDRSTIIHNTVQVNNTKQAQTAGGTALHFDGMSDGRVQVMDARNTSAYSATSEYRRTTVMVDFDDTVSYGVDFFRVIGGSDHTFALHPASDTAPTVEGLTFVKQDGGTYAGSGVAYGTFGQASGYDGFFDVSHATPTGAYSLDYKIQNFRKYTTDAHDLHLKITQLSDFVPNTVSIASAEPPKTYNNPSKVSSLLVKRTGTNLDSLFTTVLQPYDGTPYIESSEAVPVTVTAGSPASSDKVYAVKVTMENGRVDYIVYSTNNTLTCRVDDRFDFQGFVGVMTYEDGINTYAYLSDGRQIGKLTAPSAYAGTVRDFTRSLSFANSIIVTPSGEMETEDLIGRYLFVRGNAHSYKILDAVRNADGSYTLDIGDVSVLTGSSSYEIAQGNSFTIPLTREEVYTPIALKTVNGAQIRTTGSQGLRFISTIDKSDPKFSEVAEYGTVLIPTADLTDLEDLQIGATLNGHTVAKVPAKNLYAETDDTVTFTAVITDIKEKNYARAYTARAYAILEDGSIVYGNTSSSRSVYGVAKAALEAGRESEEVLALFQAIVDAVEGN